ncbi:MAG: hypothetical protein J6Z09_02740, partial [Lachnospiraceae bacterium]|nr:hypothetical protein [Lachnospiraceae bacterium]
SMSPIIVTGFLPNMDLPGAATAIIRAIMPSFASPDRPTDFLSPSVYLDLFLSLPNLLHFRFPLLEHRKDPFLPFSIVSGQFFPLPPGICPTSPFVCRFSLISPLAVVIFSSSYSFFP